MRPTFMGFETSKSSIFANQKSLDIVGNNLANTDTNGYTRQRADRVSVYPGSYRARVATSRVGLTGQGVETVGVSQMRDSFLDKRFRDEYSKSSYHAQAGQLLEDIQSALGDGNSIKDEAGLLGGINQMFAALMGYVNDPTTQSESNLVLSAFRNMTQVLQQLDAKLTNVAKQQKEDMGITVDRTNEIMKQIAHLNEMISNDSTVTLDPNKEYFRPNELLDQRNLLLDELASYGNINVTEKADGSVDVEMGGHKAVSGKTYGELQMKGNDDGTVSLKWMDSGENTKLTGGTILAYQDFINGRGTHIQTNNETLQQGIPYYRDRLDTFAAALAHVANNTVPEYDEATGKPMEDPVTKNIIYKKLLSSGGDGTGPVGAGNITISQEWTQNGAAYFIYKGDEQVEDYAQKLAYALTKDSYSFEDYGEKFSGTFAEYEIDFIGKLGTDIAYQNGRFDSTAKVADDFLDRRDAISGVSRDEETADMLKYQKSYEAAARMMTTLDDLLDVLINRTGRAGL